MCKIGIASIIVHIHVWRLSGHRDNYSQEYSRKYNQKMTDVQLREKRGVKDEKVRRSYSCSDLGQLLGFGEEGSDSENVETGTDGLKRLDRSSNAAAFERTAAHRVSAFIRLRKKQKKKSSEPVISAPLQAEGMTTPQTSKLATILPQNINFNNPFATIGRRNKRKPREGMPVVVLEKCFGPPPSSSALPTLHEQYMYPNQNPFATLPRNVSKKRQNIPCEGSGTDEQDGHSVPIPLISLSPSPSPSRSPSRSPSPSNSPSHLSNSSFTIIEKKALSSSNLTAPTYQALLGKSMEKVYIYV